MKTIVISRIKSSNHTRVNTLAKFQNHHPFPIVVQNLSGQIHLEPKILKKQKYHKIYEKKLIITIHEGEEETQQDRPNNVLFILHDLTNNNTKIYSPFKNQIILNALLIP